MSRQEDSNENIYAILLLVLPGGEALFESGPCWGFPPLVLNEGGSWVHPDAVICPDDPHDHIHAMPVWWENALVPDAWLRVCWVLYRRGSPSVDRGVDTASIVFSPDIDRVLHIVSLLEREKLCEVVVLERVDGVVRERVG